MIKYYYFKGMKISDYGDGIPSGTISGRKTNTDTAKEILEEILADNSTVEDFFVVSDFSVDEIPNELNARWCNEKYYVEIDNKKESRCWLEQNSKHWILVSGTTKTIYDCCPELKRFYFED